MKKILLFILFIVTIPTMSAKWLDIVETTGTTNAGSMGSCIATLPNGDVVIAGQYKSDELLFGSIKLSATISASKLVSANTKKAFIAKIDASGQYVWARTIDSKTPDDNVIIKLKADGNGNVYLLGAATNPVSIGSANINKTSKKAYAFIAKIDANGECAWTKVIDHYNTPEDISFDVNRNGDIVVATTVLQTDRKITQDKITYNRPGSYSSAVLIRFAPTGECIWIRGGVSEGAGSASTAKSVALDAAGNAYVTGEYMAGANVSGKLTFNERTLAFPTKLQKTPAIGAVFVAKYSPDGICEFVSNSGSNASVVNQKPKVFHCLLSNDEKSVYLVGRFTKDFDVWDNEGTTSLKQIRNQSQSSFFVTKFDASDGAYQNIYSGETKNCWVELTSMEQIGDGFYLFGNFAGNLEPAPNVKFVSTKNRLVSRQKFFPFIIKLNNDLQYANCKVLEANGETKITDACTMNGNAIVTTGTLNDNVEALNFDGTEMNVQKGYSKAFIWMFE
jgi:hypothetical protein